VAIDLSGKTALITGAAGALGRAYALALAARGAAIVVNDLGGDTRGDGASSDLADKVVREIREAGGKAISNADSVATKAGGEAITQAALDAFGSIDIVVNNAGNQRNARFEDLSEEDIESVLAVHLKGAFYVTQPAYRFMKKNGYGRIILTSSQSGIFGNPYRANYGAAKTAMLGLMNVIAQEAPKGVKVNTIFPNALGGRMGAPSGVRVDADFMAEGAKRFVSLAQILDPNYVASLVVYLASEQCQATQMMYSVLGGRYGRVFTGVSKGWLAEKGQIPTPELIFDHLSQINDTAAYDEISSGLGEMDSVIAQIKQRERQ
jgi:NAD(P)-dependent dehydrogenase (short-subunit alcohol dehydrogenase family)